MLKWPNRLSDEKGTVLIYVAITLGVLVLVTGLAADSGRAYAVKIQMSKAADGAALAAARMLNSGDPESEARKVFNANFPANSLGTHGSPTMTFNIRTDEVRGENIITVTGTTQLPTTFMRLGSIDNVNVSSMAEARRRMVDLSLVLDVSGSLGWRYPAVRDAARTFVGSFSEAHDRLSLVTFSNGARVLYPMPSSRGFGKTTIQNAIPNALPGGSTAMVEGLYRGWDELRSVSAGQQSSLRIIVLFTDGASNSVPADFANNGTARGLRTWDFPDNGADPDGQTHSHPRIEGLYHTETGVASPTSFSQAYPWAPNTSFHPTAPWLPPTSFHQWHRSSGIPTSFPMQSNTLTVNGAAQSSRRGLRDYNAAQGKYPAHVWNINNAARNLLEIIADRARNDVGDYRIRIYTIGMGELVRYMLGTMPERPEDILLRVTNDKDSPDYNAAQLEGKYFFAETQNDVGPAFQAIQNEIIRLSK